MNVTLNPQALNLEISTSWSTTTIIGVSKETIGIKWRSLLEVNYDISCQWSLSKPPENIKKPVFVFRGIRNRSVA